MSYGEVGLPVYRIAVTAHVLEHKPIGPFAEFTLRAVDAGLVEPHEIRSLLGLEQVVVDTTLAELVEGDQLALSPRGDRSMTVALTPDGRTTLQTAATVVPEEAVIEIDFDGLLRRPIPYVDNWLTPFELRELGIREIPPSPVRPPEIRDIDVAGINAVIRAVGDRREARREILALRSLERKRKFVRAVALVFRGVDETDVQVAFVVDGILSPEHEDAFSRSRFKRKLVGAEGIASAEAVVEAVLGKELVEVARQSRKESVDRVAVDAGATPEVAEAHEPVPRSSDMDPVRMLETFEHPALLKEALTTTEDRLLIISPWVRRHVADTEFFRALAARLEAGVDVFIGWGIAPLEEDDLDIDTAALKEINRLKEQFKWTFHARRLGGTHAKVLVCDKRFVVITSFNWLSFKGDPKRTFRDERGTYVAIPEKIDEQFDSWSRRIVR